MQGTKPPHCPVSGCGVRSDRWTGKKDGYPLPSLDAFTLLLSPNVTIDTNTRICKKCYNIHRRPNADLRGRTRITPLPPLNPLLGLLAAATSSPAQPSAAPSSPSFSASPPPPLPVPPPPPPPLPPPSSAPCPLSDITNAPRTQRRHDTPLKRKRELAEAAAALDAAVHFSLSFALILLSCPHFSPSSSLIPLFYHLPPVVRRPHSAVSCSSAWEAPATWMQRKVSASCRAGASSRPCHLPPVIHCFKDGITLRSDRTYSCLRSLRHVGIGNSHQSLLLGRSRVRVVPVVQCSRPLAAPSNRTAQVVALITCYAMHLSHSRDSTHNACTTTAVTSTHLCDALRWRHC